MASSTCEWKGLQGPKPCGSRGLLFSGLHIEGNTSTPSGNIGTKAIIPGLNTLGISMARGDFAPSGFSSPHVHPRASEMVLVLEGHLEVDLLHPTRRTVSSRSSSKWAMFSSSHKVLYISREMQETLRFQLLAAKTLNLVVFRLRVLNRIRRFLLISLPRHSKLMKRRQVRLVEYEGGLEKRDVLWDF
ncbi:hypothetical protein K7X08_032999 [Anisodus acutangulus]|uniref:Cupin type-1 domain-containing protein n=1 Tax=Anisodus acutangulus TaxID=402998 RepID=A0A9Q1M0R6_9SOLA|nr:hypothetical protein K7X08_032999 [Anisodus acutangulus]